jgi:four helix bundle protein
MTEGERTKRFDLEDRALRFALRVRAFSKMLRRTIANQEDGRQLIRSSAAIGANYIEANEALGEKDFIMRLRIARKEAKESRFFLRLLDTEARDSIESERQALIVEATELLSILSTIIRNAE